MVSTGSIIEGKCKILFVDFEIQFYLIYRFCSQSQLWNNLFCRIVFAVILMNGMTGRIAYSALEKNDYALPKALLLRHGSVDYVV